MKLPFPIVDAHVHFWNIAKLNYPWLASVIAVRERLAYTTTKFAVVGLTQAFALDHSHTGVRFNCTCHDHVETPFVLARLKEYPDPEKAYCDMASTQLNGRMAQEVSAASYLAVDQSGMVTGSTLMLDGGRSTGK
jgi:NAD(P)-dependent dehydrogenase (short-subunit alcohol dehydrogenase family)